MNKQIRIKDISNPNIEQLAELSNEDFIALPPPMIKKRNCPALD